MINQKTHTQILPNSKFIGKYATQLPHSKARTVAGLIDEYTRSDHFKSLSINTRKRYKSVFSMLKRFTTPDKKTLLQLKVSRVDYHYVDYFAGVMRHQYSTATIRSIFAALINVWERGLRTGRVLLNPWKNSKLKSGADRDNTWTREEVELCIKTAKELGFVVLALYIRLGYETAQRMWSDLRFMEWRNIKVLEGHTVFDFIIAKTQTQLVIPLTPAVILALEEAPKISTYIFVDKKGSLLTSAAILYQFSKLKQKTGINKDLQLRDLRRSFVTDLAQSGATMQEIVAWTGWKAPQSIINKYARLRLPTAVNAMEKLQKFRNEDTGIHTEPETAT